MRERKTEKKRGGGECEDRESKSNRKRERKTKGRERACAL